MSPHRIVDRAPAEVTPYPHNARTHSEAQIERIANSIARFGFTNPILVTADNMIIAGHGRWLAAIKVGLASVPTIVIDGWSPSELRAYIIADNQLALDAGWDETILRVELLDLRDAGFDLDLIGFPADDLTLLLDAPADVALDSDADQNIPTLPEHPITQPGDLIRLGRHRLICGDCRDRAVIDKLVAADPINLVFTSPPYAEQRLYDQTSGFTPIKPDGYSEWFAPLAQSIHRHLTDDGSFFLNIKPHAEGLDTSLYVFDLVLAHVREWGFHFATEFCWERVGVPKAVSQRFKNQFEPVYQFVKNRWKMRPEAVRHKSDAVPKAFGPGAGDTSWATRQGAAVSLFGPDQVRHHGSTGNMARLQGGSYEPGDLVGAGLAYPGNRLPTFANSHQATGHAAAFPVGLPRFFLHAFSDENDLILDPFAGSGSTLIAAELTGRVGLMVELSPAYCDVIAARFQQQTGLTPQRQSASIPPRFDRLTVLDAG